MGFLDMVPFKNNDIARLTVGLKNPTPPNKLIKRTREVVETPYGKNIQTSSYNRLTGRSVSKEKDITYKTKDEPRIKYIDKQVVRRYEDGDWKSEKTIKKLLNNGKKIKSDVQYKNF